MGIEIQRKTSSPSCDIILLVLKATFDEVEPRNETKAAADFTSMMNQAFLPPIENARFVVVTVRVRTWVKNC